MKRCFLGIIIFFILSQSACEVDHGLAPVPGRLRAQVAFRGNPPEDTQGVYLIVAPEFPPHAINELFQSPNSLPLNQDTVWTEIDLPYGHYEAYGLWWYSKDTRSNLADILAMPFDGMTFEPLGFTISKEEPFVERHLNANWENMNRDAAIRGTVYFEGEFPENTAVTAVAAFNQKPLSVVFYLVWLKSIDMTVEKGVKQHNFILPIKSGYVGYIAIFWLAENAPLYDVQIIGEAMDPDRPGELWKKAVKPDSTLSGVEIFVDWEQVKPALPEEML
ncbi:hypothetical protein JW835_12495 [bacterium]|nr:hypothetical protein [bacterium]